MSALWFVFRGNELLVREADGAADVPRDAHGLPLLRQHAVGQAEGNEALAAEVAADTPPPPGLAFRGLRALHGVLPAARYRLAGRAFQIVEWDRTHQFCGRCGAPTELDVHERARRCPRCGMLHFPRVSPAVIVLVRDGERMLLARNHNFPAGFYSTLAGFVEPGETLEEAVEREIAEEVGVRVKNIRYFGSQPWPFPHSLMIAFVCDYAGGELRLQADEIADAGWFTAENLPQLPPPLSVARTLIDWFLREGRR